MAYQQKKFRSLPAKPQGNLATPRIKKVGIDDLSDELRSEVGEVIQQIVDQIADTVATLQNNVSEALRPLAANPLLNGVYITNVKIETNGSRINHGLGRPWRGFFVTRYYDSTINEPVINIGTTKNDDTVIILKSGAGTARFDIYVF